MKVIRYQAMKGQPDGVPNRTGARFKAPPGKRHTVEACDRHRADLDAVRRIPGSPLRTGWPATAATVDRYARNRPTTEWRISKAFRLSSVSSCGFRNSAANEAISARSQRMPYRSTSHSLGALPVASA